MDAGSQFRATGAGGVQVDMVTLDEVVAGRVDLLKMDIEGAENTRLFRPLRSVPCEAFSASLWNIIPTARFRPWPVRSNQPVLPSRVCARKAAATGWPTGRLARSRRGFNPRAQQPAPRGRLEPGRGAYCKRRARNREAAIGVWRRCGMIVVFPEGPWYRSFAFSRTGCAVPSRKAN
jgi:hypothetical protein